MFEKHFNAHGLEQLVAFQVRVKPVSEQESETRDIGTWYFIVHLSLWLQKVVSVGDFFRRQKLHFSLHVLHASLRHSLTGFSRQNVQKSLILWKKKQQNNWVQLEVLQVSLAKNQTARPAKFSKHFATPKFYKAKWYLCKVKIKPMLPFSRIKWGVQGGLQGHCHVPLLEFSLLACLLAFPSLPPTLLGKYQFHTLVLHTWSALESSYHCKESWKVPFMTIVALFCFQNAQQAMITRRAFQQQLKEMLDNETPVKDVSAFSLKLNLI